MEDEKELEQYKKAFNHGYMIRERMPEVLKGMQIPENEPSIYTQGFNDGVKQFEKDYGYQHEQERDKLREQMKRSQDMNLDQGRSR